MQIEEFQWSPAVEEGTAVMARTPPPPLQVVLQEFQIPLFELFHVYFIVGFPFKWASVLYLWTLWKEKRIPPILFFFTSDCDSYFES